MAKQDYQGKNPKCGTCRHTKQTIHVRTENKYDDGTNLIISLNEPLGRLEDLIEKSDWGKANGVDMTKQQLYFMNWENVKMPLTEKRRPLRSYGVVPITATVVSANGSQVQEKGSKSLYLEARQ